VKFTDCEVANHKLRRISWEIDTSRASERQTFHNGLYGGDFLSLVTLLYVLTILVLTSVNSVVQG